jgi:drug/metabolite transporter (DMT)-like permease
MPLAMVVVGNVVYHLGQKSVPKGAHPRSVALVGVGIVAIEVGFLLAYRLGWEISAASLTASTAIAAILLPIGVFAFREAWSAPRLLGLGLCVAGLWLIHRR